MARCVVDIRQIHKRFISMDGIDGGAGGGVILTHFEHLVDFSISSGHRFSFWHI